MHRLSLMILMLGLVSGAVMAQPAPLDQADYWARLDQTRDLLSQAFNKPVPLRQPYLDDVLSLWTGIETVRLSDEQVIDIDMDWLTAPIDPADSQTMEQLYNHVNALLAARPSGSPRENPNALAALNDVLADERFQYTFITPTPLPTPTPRPTPSGSTPNYDVPTLQLPVGLGQLILLAGGALLVVALLVYLTRGLRIQPAALNTHENRDDDPDTADQARERAADAEVIQDYRAAIRYLYLSSLLLLDERGLLHYDPTLTNREHLRQIADQPQLLELLRPVVNIFERVWYGFMPVDDALYQQFRQLVDQLHQLGARR